MDILIYLIFLWGKYNMDKIIKIDKDYGMDFDDDVLTAKERKILLTQSDQENTDNIDNLGEC